MYRIEYAYRGLAGRYKCAKHDGTELQCDEDSEEAEVLGCRRKEDCHEFIEKINNEQLKMDRGVQFGIAVAKLGGVSPAPPSDRSSQFVGVRSKSVSPSEALDG